MQHNPPGGDPEAPAAKALKLIGRKYKITDLLLVDTARDTLRMTQEPIYRFRAVSAAQANGPRYEAVLAQSGAELNLEEINRRDGVTYFAGTAGTVPGPAPVVPITINPSDNKLELDQGETFTETITVTIPRQPVVAKADIYFLADTTFSMNPILRAVKADAATILTTLNGLGLDFAYGVGNYKDFPNSFPPFEHQLSPTNIAANVTAAINAWTEFGGGDLPEDQLYALHRLAQPPGGSIGWRSGSKRIIVWFGDAAGHDPVCARISGEPADVTEASVTAELVNEKIAVLAISTNIPGLDDDPKHGAFDYGSTCGAPGGSAGQATRIANATGGRFVTGANPANIAQTIIDLVRGAVTGINNVKLVPTGATTPFVTSISPPGGYGPLAGDKEHKLPFEVTFTGVVPCKDQAQVFNGTLDVVADGVVVARKRVEITAPACKFEVFYSYSVKFVCGVQPECPCACAPVSPGTYATEINIYNHNTSESLIRKRIIPVVLAGAAAGREPRTASLRAEDKLVLPPRSATMDDCCRIAELLLGVSPTSPMLITIGFLEIVSPVELSVTAVYTVTGQNSGSVSIDVEQIQPRIIRLRRG
ncbi:MAG: hypothetical protein ACRD8O_19930 [Bryobacteraceae bacterium]